MDALEGKPVNYPIRYSLGLICALAALSARAELANVYAVSDSYKLSRDGSKVWSLDPIDLGKLKKKSLCWDAERNEIELAGARGECVAFQLILEPDAGGAADVDVKTGELKGPDTIPPGSMSLFKEWYIEAKNISNENNAPSTGLGWYPDALVPWDVKDHGKYKAPPFAIEAGQIQAVWVDLTIPREIKPGAYKGQISVVCAGKAHALNVELRVYGFELPKEIHNQFFMNGDLGDILEAGHDWLTGGTRQKQVTGALLDYENECYRMARAHRFTWGNMYFEGHRDRASIFPKIETDASGTITSVDWSLYDARFSRVLDPKNNIFGAGEAPIEVWRLPITTMMSHGNEWQAKKAKSFPADEHTWEQFPRWLKKHWDEKGWDIDKGYVYLADEPREADLGALEEYTRKLHSATTPPLHSQIAILSNAKNYATFIPEFQKRFGGILDRWMWSANSIQPKALQDKFTQGEKLGFYQGNEPYVSPDVLDKDGLAMRTWSWISWMYKMKFMCNYSCTEYGDIGSVAANRKTVWEEPKVRATGNLLKSVYVYPGDYVDYMHPIPSLRMKQVRRGQQDYEYMWLLAQAGKRDSADADVRKIIVKALAEAADKPNAVGTRAAWSRDPELWDKTVRSWGEQLEGK
jgi:hypothetical protein